MFKRLICIVLLLSIAFGVCACGNGNTEENTVTATYYEEKEIGSNSGLTAPAAFRVNSAGQLVFYDQAEKNNSKYVIISGDGTPAGEINVDISGDGSVFTLDAQDNLYIAAGTQTSDTLEYKLYCVSKKGEILKTIDLGKAGTGQRGKEGRYYIADIAVDSNGNIYLAYPSELILVLDKDGNRINTIGSQGYARLSVGSGNYLFAGNSGKDTNFVEKIDISNGESVWKTDLGEKSRYVDMKYSKADNSIYIMSDMGIDRIDDKGQLSGNVLNFSEYSLLASGNFVQSMGVDPSGNIFALTLPMNEGVKGSALQPPMNGNHELFIYTLKTGKSESLAKKSITVAIRRTERHLQTAASIFQRDNPGYKINFEFPDSSQGGEGRKNYIDGLNTDIFAGKGPDIIQTDWLPYEKYISKGLLEDLSGYIARDKSFDSSQYYTNILSGVKRDGHMYFMPTLFNFSVLMANMGILEEEGISLDSSKWTWNDFRTAAGKVMKKDENGNLIRTALPDVSSLDLLNYFIMFGDFGKFTDVQNKSASFDSQEFRNMLEFVRSFGNNYLTSKGNFKASMGDVMEAAYRSAIVFMPNVMQDYMDYAMAKAMFSGKVGILHFPSENGVTDGTYSCGEAYGILSTSEYKDKAWKFIKILISEDVQSNLDVGGFTVNKAAQIKRAEQEIEVTADGKAGVNIGSKEFKFQKLTQEDIAFIDEMIPGLNRYMDIDDQVVQIAMEEAEAYFSGDKDVGTTAKLIQDRVETYLKE